MIGEIKMAYWIFKVGEQNIYKDALGKKYLFDNTHSLKVVSGDYFIYLSKIKNRYEFIGYGKINDLKVRKPRGKEVRNDKVKNIYTAYLTDLHWFEEPLDFSNEKGGKLNRSAVGITSALGWSRSLSKLDKEMFWRIVSLAQPGSNIVKTEIASNKRKGSPGKKWLTPRKAIATILDEAEGNEFEPESFEDARNRTIRFITQRQGQAKFRKSLLAAYGYSCAITNCNVECALQAAHIYPYRGTETNVVTNGLLLRSDIHDLFDLGLITIDTSDMTVQLHPSLHPSSYNDLHGKLLSLPKEEDLRPNKTYLDYHRAYWNDKR